MSEERRDAPATERTAATEARLDSLPTIAGLDVLAFRMPEGTIVAARYRIVSMLGLGGMGAVYRAHDQLLGLDVALKVLRSEIAGDESFLQRFRQELIVARRVTHRHVVRIHDLGEHAGMPFMTMDYIPGRSLREALLATGTMEAVRTLRLIRQVAEALGEAHRQGVVHRDLKPSNILLDERGDAYVTDFGVARSLHAPGLTRTGEVLGTPDYLAPEQARGEKVDGRCDLYALGLIWFEMLSGERPYQGGSLLEVLAQHMSGRTRTLKEIGVAVPPPVDVMLRRCLARDPADRYPEAAALIADLDDLGAPGRRRWLRRIEAVAAMLVLLLAIAMLWRQLPRLRRDGPPPPLRGAAPAATPRPHAVAILPFVTAATAPDLAAWSTSGLPEALAGALQESPAVRVVPAVRVAQTLRDLGFEPAALDERALGRIADLLQADRLVTGRLEGNAGQVRVTATVSDVSGNSVSEHPLKSQAGGTGELFALTDRLGAELRQRLELVGTPKPGRAITSSSEAFRAYSDGKAKLAAGDTRGGTKALETAVALDRGFADAWLELSRAYMAAGRSENALQAAESASASAAGSDRRVAFEARAQKALLGDHPQEAQGQLLALVARFPNYLPARTALAEAYAGQGSYKQAIDTLREVVARDPKDPRAWYLLGRYAIQAGDLARAIDDYLTRALVLHNALGNKQGRAEVLNAMGVALDRLGKVAEAAEQYRQAAVIRREIGDRRGLAVTEDNLGVLLVRKGDFAGAQTALSDALKIYQGLDNRAGIAKVQNNLGVLEEERGRLPAALERYELALKLRQDGGDEAAEAESYNNVGYVYFLLGDYESARLRLERSRALYEQNHDDAGALRPLQSRGACELAQGQWDAAARTFHDSLERARAAQQKDAMAVATGSLAQLAFLEGRHGGALENYALAAKMVDELKDRRGQAEFALGAAETLLELGALDAAAQRLAQTEALRSADPTRRNTGLGREQEAQLLLLQARLLAARSGDSKAARTAFAAAVTAAVASQLPPRELAARLGAAELAGDRPALQDVLGRAQHLGHAALELRAAEDLARSDLANGAAGHAAGVLVAALQRVRHVGSWQRTWELHWLLARAQGRQGQKGHQAGELTEAQSAAARVAAAVPAELRAGFLALPEVRELGPLPAPPR